MIIYKKKGGREIRWWTRRKGWGGGGIECIKSGPSLCGVRKRQGSSKHVERTMNLYSLIL